MEWDDKINNFSTLTLAFIFTRNIHFRENYDLSTHHHNAIHYNQRIN